jgi:hypothetical protein
LCGDQFGGTSHDRRVAASPHRRWPAVHGSSHAQTPAEHPLLTWPCDAHSLAQLIGGPHCPYWHDARLWGVGHPSAPCSQTKGSKTHAQVPPLQPLLFNPLA